MRVGIKYCGGCNPRYDRAGEVNKVLDHFRQADGASAEDADNSKTVFEYAEEGGVYDVLLTVCGCVHKCANTEPYKFNQLVGIDDGFKATEAIKELEGYRDGNEADRETEKPVDSGSPDTGMEVFNNMDWQSYYSSRLVSAHDAVSKIENDTEVVLAHCIGEPKTLINAMIDNREQYRNVRIHHMVRLAPMDFATPGFEENFIVDPFFGSANSRAAMAEGRGDFTPSFFHEIPISIRKGRIGCDTALVQVSPPDKFGYVSTGVAVDYTIQAIRTAKLSIAQVNPKMPRTYGSGVIHISELDWFVEAEEDLYELPPPKITDVERSIGEHCAELVEDGSTLQLGIGGIPDAVMLFLKDKKDLGIHSEMIADGTLELYKTGVINNSMKSENKGRMTIAFLMGTRALYDFVDENPVVEVHTVDYVNHPITISRQYKMVSINSAMQTDLMGQINAEAIGLKQFSAVGGQVDFVRGAAMSEEGKSIIAMPSVTVKKDGTKISKIVPFIDQGAPVTTSRCDAQYIVTEYGIAELKGKNLRTRARNLIAIAHPEMRDGLAEEFERRFFEKP